MASEELRWYFDEAERGIHGSQRQSLISSPPHDPTRVIFQSTGPSFAERMKNAKLGDTNEALGSHPARQRQLQPFQYNFREIGGRGIGDTLDEPQENWSTERISTTSTNRWIPVVGRSSELLDLPEETETCESNQEHLYEDSGACNSCERFKADQERLKFELFFLRLKHDQLRGERSDLERMLNNVKWLVQEMDGLAPDGRITNSQMINAVEDIRNRRVCYETWFPGLSELFKKVDAEEIVQMEAKAKAV